MSDLALIQARDCDNEELVIINEALASENQVLIQALADKEKHLDYLKQKLGTGLVKKADSFKNRLVLHTSISVAIYTTLAGADGFLYHPFIFTTLLALNIAIWCMTNVIAGDVDPVLAPIVSNKTHTNSTGPSSGPCRSGGVIHAGSPTSIYFGTDGKLYDDKGLEVETKPFYKINDGEYGRDYR